MKKIFIPGILILLFSIVMLSACGAPETTTTTITTATASPTTTTPEPTTEPGTITTTPSAITEEAARQMAYDFVINSPTFAFDGMQDTLELVHTETYKCVGCWDFIYEFDSRHGGYGDRTDQMVAQVITHHQAVINIRNSVLTGAVLDEVWDMQVQMMISTEEESLKLAREYLESSPTFTFDGIKGSIVYVETLQTLGFYTWGFVFDFECANAGYGDRTGQMVATVITRHTATVVVSGGEVTGGAIDDYWNMKTQQPIKEPTITTATAP